MTKLQTWKDGRADPAVRRAADECLGAWGAEHGETLKAASRSGRGTIFESEQYLVVGRTSKTESLGRNPGQVHWSSITPGQFRAVSARAKREGRRLVFLLLSLGASGTRYFEVPGERVRWTDLPKRSDGNAFFKVYREGDGYRLETAGDPIDVSTMERRIAHEARTPGAGPPPPYSGIITIDPRVRAGKPCIRGMRITVQDVLEYLAGGMSHADILGDFPDLTEEDIRACLAFAADRERRLRSVS